MGNKTTRKLAVLLLVFLITLIAVVAVRSQSSWIFSTVVGIAVVAIQHQKLSSNSRAPGDRSTSLKKVTGVLTEFSYEDLMLATGNFSSILGKGGSGCVFRGMLRDGTRVAVKQMECQERAERGFCAEVAALGCLQHTNIVSLHGCCVIPKGPRFLVYELIPNGSLDTWIFPKKLDKNKPGGCLSWELRYKVALDIAKALSYLHNGCSSRILHLDVKPENILLSDSFRAFVSDFGLSELMRKEESIVVTRVRGTKAYMAPEWILQNGVSAKCDVYSYGMVLLEMIGGRRNVFMPGGGGEWEYFPKIVYEKLNEGNVMELVDKRLLEEGTVDPDEVRRLVYVALWCIQEKNKLRPDMAQVVNMLECRSAVDQPPETEMFLFDLLLTKTEKNHDQNRLRPVNS